MRLDAVASSLIPLNTELQSASSFFHLHPNFSLERIFDYENKKPLMRSIIITNPQLFQRLLQRFGSDLQLQKSNLYLKSAEWQRISSYLDLLIRDHAHYQRLLSEIYELIPSMPQDKLISEYKYALEEHRIGLRENLDSISRQSSVAIQHNISNTVRRQKSGLVYTMVLALITVTVSLFLAIFIFNSFKPLQVLGQSTKDIASGNFHKRVHIVGPREVEDLAEEFNAMAQSLEERDTKIFKQQEELIASQKMAVLGEMATKINHELRNPLNAMSLNIDTLKDEKNLSPEGQDIIDLISQQIDRLHHTTRHYLNMAKFGQETLTHASIQKILDRVYALLKPECDSLEIDFMRSYPETLLPVYHRPYALEHALLNLCRNAIESLTSGQKMGINTDINDAQQLTVDVWDEGPGIDKEIQKKIFEPFYTTKSSGTGLGLAVTQELIRSQNAYLEYHARKNRGSIFRIVFEKTS